MSPKGTKPTRQSRLKIIASMTNTEILARSAVSGVLFAILLLVLDMVQSRPIDLVNTAFLGFVFAVVLALFDTLQRSGARKNIQ